MTEFIERPLRYVSPGRPEKYDYAAIVGDSRERQSDTSPPEWRVLSIASLRRAITTGLKKRGYAHIYKDGDDAVIWATPMITDRNGKGAR